jgi:hypothetical protein
MCDLDIFFQNTCSLTLGHEIMLLSKLVFCDELFIGSVIRYFGYFPMALWVIIANFMASSVKFLMDFGYHTCSIF